MAKLKSQVGDNRPWKDHSGCEGRSMRAVKGSLGHSLSKMFREVEGPRSTRAG